MLGPGNPHCHLSVKVLWYITIKFKGPIKFFALFLKLFEMLVSKDVPYFSHYPGEIFWPKGIPLGR